MENYKNLDFSQAAREIVESLEGDEELSELDSVISDREEKKKISEKRRYVLDEVALQLGALFEEEGFNGDQIQADAFLSDARNFLGSGNGLKKLNEIYQTARGGDVFDTEELISDLYGQLRNDFEKSFETAENEEWFGLEQTNGPEVVYGVVHNVRREMKEAIPMNEGKKSGGMQLDASTKRKLGMQSAPMNDLGTNITPINRTAANALKSDGGSYTGKRRKKRNAS